MKQTLIAVALAALCGLAYVACGQNEISTTSPKSSGAQGKEQRALTMSFTAPTVQSAGAIHNYGLAYVRGRYDHGITFTSTRDQAAYILSLTADFFQSTMGWDRSLITTAWNQEALTAMLDRRYPASDVEVWDRMKRDPMLRNNVAPGDIPLIDEAMSVFTQPSAGMSGAQIANRIIGTADSLMALWSSKTGQNGGELSKSFLSLMKGSAAHWRDQPLATTETSGTPPELGQLVQIDCVGYLVGWWSALATEISANGRADISNQYKRIGAGAATAVSWSMGGPIRKFFGG